MAKKIILEQMPSYIDQFQGQHMIFQNGKKFDFEEQKCRSDIIIVIIIKLFFQSGETFPHSC